MSASPDEQAITVARHGPRLRDGTLPVYGWELLSGGATDAPHVRARAFQRANDHDLDPSMGVCVQLEADGACHVTARARTHVAFAEGSHRAYEVLGYAHASGGAEPARILPRLLACALEASGRREILPERLSSNDAALAALAWHARVFERREAVVVPRPFGSARLAAVLASLPGQQGLQLEAVVGARRVPRPEGPCVIVSGTLGNVRQEHHRIASAAVPPGWLQTLVVACEHGDAGPWHDALETAEGTPDGLLAAESWIDAPEGPWTPRLAHVLRRIRLRGGSEEERWSRFLLAGDRLPRDAAERLAWAESVDRMGVPLDTRRLLAALDHPTAARDLLLALASRVSRGDPDSTPDTRSPGILGPLRELFDRRREARPCAGPAALAAVRHAMTDDAVRDFAVRLTAANPPRTWRRIHLAADPHAPIPA